MQEPQAGRQEGDDRRRLMLKETEAFRKGAWSQLQPQPGGWGIETSDGFVGCAWVGEAGRHVVAMKKRVYLADTFGRRELRVRRPGISETAV